MRRWNLPFIFDRRTFMSSRVVSADCGSDRFTYIHRQLGFALSCKAIASYAGRDERLPVIGTHYDDGKVALLGANFDYLGYSLLESVDNTLVWWQVFKSREMVCWRNRTALPR